MTKHQVLQSFTVTDYLSKTISKALSLDFHSVLKLIETSGSLEAGLSI